MCTGQRCQIRADCVSEEIKENEMQCKKLCSLLRARAAGGSQSLEDSKCVFRG